jgi:ubiquinone biosynthesis protein
MEFIPGLDVGTARDCPVALRRHFARSGLAAIYRMLFVDGFVHCDLHPGNLYFTRGGAVVVLDAGFSVQLTERLRRLFAEFFLNMAVGRGRRCAEIVVESSAGLRPDADLDSFLDRMAALVVRSHGLAAKDFSLIAFATEMFDLQRRFGVHAAPELIFPLLSLLVIEGTIRDLDPEIDFQETAKPMLNKGLFSTRQYG